MENKTIKATFKTPYGEIFHEGFYKTKKSLRISKERANLKYGAHLTCEAYDIVTNEKIYCLA